MSIVLQNQMFSNYIKLCHSYVMCFVLCEATKVMSFSMTHRVRTSPAIDTYGVGFDFTFTTETLDWLITYWNVHDEAMSSFNYITRSNSVFIFFD